MPAVHWGSQCGSAMRSEGNRRGGWRWMARPARQPTGAPSVCRVSVAYVHNRHVEVSEHRLLSSSKLAGEQPGGTLIYCIQRRTKLRCRPAAACRTRPAGTARCRSPRRLCPAVCNLVFPAQRWTGAAAPSRREAAPRASCPGRQGAIRSARNASRRCRRAAISIRISHTSSV